MTGTRNIEQVLDLWIGDGPSELPDRVLEDALFEIDNTQQRGALGMPSRFTGIPTPIRLLLVAALVGAAAGAALVVGGAVRPRDDAPSPPIRALGAGILIGSDPSGVWTGWRPSAYGDEAGVFTLTIPSEPDALFATSPGGRQVLLGDIDINQPGILVLGPTDRCPDAATYDYHVSDDGGTLTMASRGDACTDRESVLDGDWGRRLVDVELVAGERYRIATYNALVDVTLPGDFGARVTTGPNPVSWLKLDNGSVAFIVIAGSEPLGDRCHEVEGERAPLRTLDDFSEWIAANQGIDASAVTETTVAGHPARVVDVAGRRDCDEPYNGMPFTLLSRGLHARDWAVEVGGQALLLELVDDSPPHDPMTPSMLGIGDALIRSIEISAP